MPSAASIVFHDVIDVEVGVQHDVDIRRRNTCLGERFIEMPDGQPATPPASDSRINEDVLAARAHEIRGDGHAHKPTLIRQVAVLGQHLFAVLGHKEVRIHQHARIEHGRDLYVADPE